ncbi:MAG TPA: chemotaxis protein CheA [Vampirovibrionales bacterium]
MHPGDEYWGLFFEEVETHLESLNEKVENLRSTPENESLIQEVFRHVHTIKGMAATVGFESVSRLCHKMEELFDFYRKNPQPLTANSLNTEIKALDSLFSIVENIANSGEEHQSCLTLSDSLCSELTRELNKLNNTSQEIVQIQQKNNQPKSKTGKSIHITFKEDCAMPGVRSFMALRDLETLGEIKSSIPKKDDLLERIDLLETGFFFVIETESSESEIREILARIVDIQDIQITSEQPDPDDRLKEIKQEPVKEKIPPLGTTSELIIQPTEIQKYLNDDDFQRWTNSELKLYHIDLYLSDDVVLPEEQFVNLLANLNDYIGKMVQSIPSFEDLKNRNQESQNLLEAIYQENKREENFNSKERARRRLQFTLLINGSHKNILDFLTDACELRKVEIKEIKFKDGKFEKIDLENTNKESSNQPSTPVPLDNSKAKQNDIKTTFVRVNLATLELLMNSVGELVINHNRIKAALEDTYSEEIKASADYLHQVTSKIQQLVMSVRMVPIKQVFNRFPRFIRDISRELNKEVELEIEGEETEVDRIILDELNEIFVHLIRNAIDHGIETKEEREKANKEIKGLIKVKAYSRGNNVLIAIQDDGKGINLEKVKSIALKKNLLDEEALKNLSQENILDLIFHSGFSTADSVSSLSGRGVGMDVVKEKIASLGGTITLNSEEGKGTQFKLSIPSTISIIHTLLVKTEANSLYAIPLSEIQEIVSIDTDSQVFEVGNCKITSLHEQTIPLINLSKYLEKHYKKIEERKDTLVAIINSEGKQYGLAVEHILGQQEIVIKPVSKLVNKKGLINGATVFGDGSVAMILSIDKLVRTYLDDYRDSPFLNNPNISDQEFRKMINHKLNNPNL